MSKRNSSSIFGVIVIVVGLYFLASNLGLPIVTDFDFGDLIALLWPMLLIGWGLDALSKRNYVVGAIFSLLGVNFMIDNLAEYLPFLSPFTNLIWPASIILFGLYIMVAPPKVASASEQSFKSKKGSRRSSEERRERDESRAQSQTKQQTTVQIQDQAAQQPTLPTTERLFSQKTIDSQVLVDPYADEKAQEALAKADQTIQTTPSTPEDLGTKEHPALTETVKDQVIKEQPVIRTVSLSKAPDPLSTTVRIPEPEVKPVKMALDNSQVMTANQIPTTEAQPQTVPQQKTETDHVIHIKSSPEFSNDTDFSPPKTPKSHTRMYQTTFNSKKLTFTDSDFKEGLNTIDLSCLFGEVVLLVPPTMDITLNASVTLGDLNFLGHKFYGVSTVTDHYQSPRTTGKTLVINASVILGDVKIKTL